MQEKHLSLAGWVMIGLFALFMLGASAAPKLLGLDVAKSTFEPLGWSTNYLLMIGLIELVLTILIIIPRTALIGGILMMGLLGGAMATNLRADMPLFSHTLFSIYLGAWMWAGIWLRSPSIRAVLP